MSLPPEQHANSAISHARRAVQQNDTNRKIDELARAVEAIAWAVREMSKSS